MTNTGSETDSRDIFNPLEDMNLYTVPVAILGGLVRECMCMMLLLHNVT
jgi:hypothetical protein